MKTFYRVSEVQEILNLGRTKTYDLIRSGVIPSVEIDGNIRVPAKPFHEWIDTKIALCKRSSSGGSGTDPETATEDSALSRHLPSGKVPL